MGLKGITLVLIATFLLLSACSWGEGDPTEELPSYDISTTKPAATPSPLPTATLPPTATAAPTPIGPSIEIDTPSLTENGRLTITEVVIPDAGWLVIYQDVDGEPGDMLGYEQLKSGENSQVTIVIAPRNATPTLIARLHEDAGTAGIFEYPGPDAPLNDGPDIVAEIFQVDIQLPMPSINVADQIIASDGLLHVKEVFALEPGWLVIHNHKNDEIGPAIGQVPVEAGQNNDLAFPIRWQIASTDLLAVMYEDKEQPGGFDKETDLPILDGGSAVVAEFSVTLPPDIFVYDQGVHDGKITVDRATSDGPGWIAAYHDEEGQPGLIIGFAYLEDGVNEIVEVELLEASVTSQLFLILHEDSGNLGEFDFPSADLPVIYEDQLLPPFVIQTSPGNYLITQDQSIGEENSIIVPLVTADLDTWLVIYNLDETGKANEIIGQTWLSAGINRNVPVTINPGRSSEEILAMLHQDNAPLEQFDFPDGADIPLLRNRQPIQSPFMLEMPQEEIQPLP
jgi:hypothetical protein